MQLSEHQHMESTFSLNIKGKLHTFKGPLVMGILNITADSFYDGGRFLNVYDAEKQVVKMLHDGAVMIDIGASSSRPGSIPIGPNEEIDRLQPIIEHVSKQFPNALISVDTFRSEVAKRAVLAGAHIINDISAGDDDEGMLETVAALKVPYIAMHKKGTTQNMQVNPSYEDVTSEVCSYFGEKLNRFNALGINDVILDPGFGFGKTVSHNYQLLRDLETIHRICRKPILVGLSRKSMITKVLQIKSEAALNGTTVLNTIALVSGANILRVHDVKEAMECIAITNALFSV